MERSKNYLKRKRRQLKKAIERQENRKAQSKGFFESQQWLNLRFEVLRKYGRKCMLCGIGPGHGVWFHVDHIKPRFHYPELAYDINNLQVLCQQCNVGKGAKKKGELDFRPKEEKPDRHILRKHDEKFKL